MNTYESKQKRIRKEQHQIYQKLSDLRNVEKYAAALPEDMKEKVQDLQFDQDSISCKVPMAGTLTMRIIDREEPKTIKFGLEGVPMQANMWIQLVGVAEDDTRMKLTVKADIPLMLRPMIGNKLEEGVEKLAEMIAMSMQYGG